MAYKGKSYMEWLKNRFRYAFAGLWAGIRYDKSIRLQFLLGIITVIVGFILKISPYDWLWITLAITLVLMAEIFNSCLEKTVDYISKERNPQAGLIKDMAAAAVLVVSCFALVVAFVILFPPFVKMFF